MALFQSHDLYVMGGNIQGEYLIYFTWSFGTNGS